MKKGLCIALLIVGISATDSNGQTLAPPYDNDYALLSLGSVPGVPTNYGGLTFLAGDPNTLLIGGSANQASGAIYSIGVVRDADNHIIGFSGSATLFATAPNIDGGLAYGPGGVLFATTYSNNNLLQYLPGSNAPDKTINLTPLGIASSTGSVNFVPTGFPGAGGIRILSYNGGGMYSADLVPDGGGTFDLANVALLATTGGGPEGIIWVPNGSPEFPNPSVLISEYSAGAVRAYELDANGIPIIASRQNFITGLTGAEGAAIDPLTNDFLFSTFGGGNQILRVSGFAAIPEPTTLLLSALGLGGIALGVRRARRRRVTPKKVTALRG